MDDGHPNPNSEFETLFDECLGDVLRGTRSIEECASQYPQYADELRPALQAGLLTSRLKSPKMAEASVEMLEMRLRAKLQIQTSLQTNGHVADSKVIQPKRTFWLPVSRAAALFLVVFFIALGSGTGAVAASANAMPGDWLYGLKRLWEAIVLALSSITNETDDIYLQIAERRLDEVEELSLRGQLNPEALRDLHNTTALAITQADAETLPYVLAYLDDANRRLEVIQADSMVLQLSEGIRAMTTPVFNDSGLLEAQSTLPSTFAVEPVSSATPTLTLTVTPTSTVSPTATLSSTPSITPTATLTLTPTPRVPATATRTPTLTVTPTASATPSVTPTHTWTPLPIPTLPPQTPLVPVTDEPGSNPGNGGGNETPDEEATVRYRSTEQSVYLTQTAGAPPTTAP